jgi:hypothetical protein
MQNLHEEIYLATFLLTLDHVANAEFRTTLAGNSLGTSNELPGTNELNFPTLGIGEPVAIGQRLFGTIRSR